MCGKFLPSELRILELYHLSTSLTEAASILATDQLEHAPKLSYPTMFVLIWQKDKKPLFAHHALSDQNLEWGMGPKINFKLPNK